MTSTMPVIGRAAPVRESQKEENWLQDRKGPGANPANQPNGSWPFRKAAIAPAIRDAIAGVIS